MSEIQVAPGRVIIALGSNSWGRGATEKEALKNWKANLSWWHKGTERTVVLVDASENGWVGGMGEVITPSGEERAKKIKEITVKVRK